MNKQLTLSAIAMFAVILGVGVVAPAFAIAPPADPRSGDNTPSISCEDLAASLDGLAISEELKAKLLERAGCVP